MLQISLPRMAESFTAMMSTTSPTNWGRHFSTSFSIHSASLTFFSRFPRGTSSLRSGAMRHTSMCAARRLHHAGIALLMPHQNERLR